MSVISTYIRGKVQTPLGRFVDDAFKQASLQQEIKPIELEP